MPLKVRERKENGAKAVGGMSEQQDEAASCARLRVVINAIPAMSGEINRQGKRNFSRWFRGGLQRDRDDDKNERENHDEHEKAER